MILSCNKVNKSFGVTDILKDITFLINETDKVALVGVNGAGKSTLFKIILGEISKDSGDISLAKGATLGYLAQNFETDLSNTIYDVALSSFEDLILLEEELANLSLEIANNPEDKKLIEKYDKTSTEFSNKDGYIYKSLAKGALIGLGFSEEDLQRKFNTLSGGEKTRVLLAKLLISKHDILLLDEPTNHLDISAIEWLENYLKNYKKAIIIISHDRYFLDKIVTKVIEIENCYSTLYHGNFTDFSVQKEINRELQLSRYIEQQKEVARQQEIIRTFRSYATEKAIKRAKSREKLLAKMELVEPPMSAPTNMSLEISPQIQSGFEVLQCKDLRKSFDDNEPLFENASFDIFRGDVIALIGANGAGKSTLINIITEKIKSDFGEISLGTNVNIAYYDQENQNLSEHKTIFEEISDYNPRLTNQEIRNSLARFVFVGDEIYKKIGNLSGGEKGRVSLCKLMLSSANLLILDEPTNHLDMFSKEILENAVNSYGGTVLYISHDRYFINNTATKIIELKNKKLNFFEGSYDNYIEKTRFILEDSVSYKDSKEISSNKVNYLKQKEEQAKFRKQKKALENCEKSIESLEQLILECDEELAKEEVYTNSVLTREFFDKKTSYTKDLEKLYSLWEELQLS